MTVINVIASTGSGTGSTVKPLKSDPTPIPTIGNSIWLHWIGHEAARSVHHNQHRNTRSKIRKMSEKMQEDICSEVLRESELMWTRVRHIVKDILGWLHKLNYRSEQA